MANRIRSAMFLLWGLSGVCLGSDTSRPRPLIKDFLGICVHTVQFKPDLYKPICRQVRDYHSLNWDLGDETDHWPTFPLARNQVNWQSMYREWTDAGYEIDVCVMLGGLPFDKWINPVRDAETYGFSFARYFGPSGHNLVTAVEIGNEPGDLNDEQYRILFENMAKGIRIGDSKLKIVTCATTAGKSHKYAKSLECVKGLEDLYDVINVHSYPQVKGWPTWQRSFPEDPTIPFLKDIQDAIDWRDAYAPGKEVWITEFGWDCTTQPNSKEGTFKDWIGNTDIEQARYLVRSWLIFSAMSLERAYMYWFNDADKPQVHAASGLTRNYQPKPSFWAVAHLQKTLGEYRFDEIIQKNEEAYVYSYIHGNNPEKHLYVCWCPAAGEKKVTLTMNIGDEKVVAAEQMPYDESKPVQGEYQETGEGTVRLQCTESPLFLWTKE